MQITYSGQSSPPCVSFSYLGQYGFHYGIHVNSALQITLDKEKMYNKLYDFA